MFADFTPTAYTLYNCATGRRFADESGWTLQDPTSSQPSLLRAEYAHKQLDLKPEDWGLYRFASWLPVNRPLQGSAAPVTYRSEGLARALGLEKLYITFNGWWPEKGALMQTCSFKETEAYSVCAHLSPTETRTLVVASAGNTARAFAKVCSDNKIPLLICIPYDNLPALWFAQALDPCVKIICSPAGSDYYDAIALGDLACSLPQCLAEGGAKNIARRDGMATTVLSAVTAMGEIPAYYFQAVGSGTGAIAAWEANLRLLEDGRYGQRLMRLMLSQNYPFIPMYQAWKQGSRTLAPMEPHTAREQAAAIQAKVLSNRKPPYPIAGGLFDALTATQGEMTWIDNPGLEEAATLFYRTEGRDLHPAAAVATASLVKMVGRGQVDRSAPIMLNITGGGELAFKQGHPTVQATPLAVLDPAEDPATLLPKIAALL